MITAQHLRVIADAPKATPLMIEIASAMNRHAARYGVTHHKSLLQALANFSVETGGFRKLTENLNYSAKRLTQVWPKRFPTLKSAAPFANNPKALAEKVYGGRMGNEPGEGWIYIGRGPGQATGEDNYELAEKLTGIPFTKHPELMGKADEGIQAALALWAHWKLDVLAKAGKTRELRQRWNGGTHGLKEVEAAIKRGALLHLEVPAYQEAPPPAKRAEQGPAVKEMDAIVAETKPAISSPPVKDKSTSAIAVLIMGLTAAGAWAIDQTLDVACSIDLIAVFFDKCGG
jgi:putative chitinase